MVSLIREFFRLESASGILMLFAMLLAMLAENSFLNVYYDALLTTPVEIRLGELNVAKPLLLWVNDGLMAVFFFLIGLELKREVLEGELAEPSQIILPAFAAIGGMAFPAIIYVLINQGDATALRGWAIPSATDIAFALAILSLLGNKVPIALKLFLLTLAIIDDMGAIVIIAIFYTTDLSLMSLGIASVCLALLGWFNFKGIHRTSAYIFVGLVMWVAVLKSGVHATLAGVLLAFFIPLRTSRPDIESPLRRLEEDLHPAVAYGILPLFAFMNTGIPLLGLEIADLFKPVPLGIALGLFIGNQIGITAMSWIAVKLRFTTLPKGVGWSELYGVALLCGIGFTMSLFISTLAFEQGGSDISVDDRLGILLGSFLSGVCGYLWLKWRLYKRSESPPII